ncbi:Tn3 family transposase [Actinomadura coerulea]|uniref:Tn3 family transposase n=1 Tax=Actinomadura coerulea TaxID=46159 RepID=UPI003417CF79
MGIGGVVVPGTLRDSLFILDAPHRRRRDPPRDGRDRHRLLLRLQFISDDGYRRMIGTQLNVQEGRHRPARRIAFGNRGELRQHPEGMEGQLGVALNAVVWWNTLYLDAAVKQIRVDGFAATDGMCARLSPIAYEHINFLGRYAFTRADPKAGLRSFHDPAAEA